MIAKHTGVALLSFSLSVLFLGGCDPSAKSTQTSTPQPPHLNAEHTGHADASSSPNSKEIWSCPMHPKIRKDAPGKCPVCHMDLVKVESEERGAEVDAPSGHGSFQLSDRRMQMIGVKIGEVEKRELFKEVEAPGRVAFDPELYTAQSEYIEAVKQLERVKNSPLEEVRRSAQNMVDSARLRLKVLGLSNEQIKELRRKGRTASNLLITEAGEDVWVYAEVFEMDLAYVEPGLKAKITGGALSGQELKGKVVAVDTVINTSTRTAKVRILVPNAKGALRPESFVDVTILSPMGEQIAVPMGTIFDTGKEAWAFVVNEKGEFVPSKVQIDFRADHWVAVRSGLEVGQKIVTSANFLIDSESRLKGVLLSGGEEMGSTKAPECPEGQFWHAEMKHCMTEVPASPEMKE